MGEVVLRIAIAKSLFKSLPDDIFSRDSTNSSVRIASNKTSVSFVEKHSADTTIRELVDGNFLLRKLFFGDSDETKCSIEVNSKFTLWDCTLNPPKDITSWPRQDYPDLQGPKSKTLHSAGLFPSGKLMAIPEGMNLNTFSDYNSNLFVDVQYNSNENTDDIGKINGVGRVNFRDPSLQRNVDISCKESFPLPSKIMSTVANRFAAEEREEELSRLEAIESRRGNVKRKAQKERERVTKLEQRIAMLEEQSNEDSEQSKKKKISDQVLRMLVKSRATGDENLKEQDRLYFQCLVLVDDNANTFKDGEDDGIMRNALPFKEYRYFSPQDTFSKIENSFRGKYNKNNEVFSEVLSRRSVEYSGGNKTSRPLYHRFPRTMRLFEAESHGYLSLSENITNYFDDILIVRWYRDREDTTPLIQDKFPIIETKDKSCTACNNTDMNAIDGVTKSETIQTITDMKIDAKSNAATTFEDFQLSDAIREMDNLTKRGVKKGTSTKKSLATALKVRQMKMKSKAKGNKKIKIEDRVFLEVVSISEFGAKPICECFFFSRNDPIERIIVSTSVPLKKDTAENWEILLPQDGSRYRSISASLPLKEAEEKALLKSFDRIIIRPKIS